MIVSACERLKNKAYVGDRSGPGATTFKMQFLPGLFFDSNLRMNHVLDFRPAFQMVKATDVGVRFCAFAAMWMVPQAFEELRFSATSNFEFEKFKLCPSSPLSWTNITVRATVILINFGFLGNRVWSLPRYGVVLYEVIIRAEKEHISLRYIFANALSEGRE